MNSMLAHPAPSMSSSACVLSSGISLKKIYFLLRGYIRSGNISSQSSQPGLAEKCALNKASSHHGYHQFQQHHFDEYKRIFTSILDDFVDRRWFTAFMRIWSIICMNISIQTLWCLWVIHLTSILAKYPIPFSTSVGDWKCAILLIAVSGCYTTVSHGDNSCPVLNTCFNFLRII